MGDRALVIFKSNGEYSPVAYLHWGGEAVPAYIEDLKILMDIRTNDCEYAYARFLGICHTANVSNISLGGWNLPKDFEGTPEYLERMSHGDAGVIIVNCEDFSWKAFGGYLSNEV